MQKKPANDDRSEKESETSRLKEVSDSFCIYSWLIPRFTSSIIVLTPALICSGCPREILIRILVPILQFTVHNSIDNFHHFSFEAIYVSLAVHVT